ncbi:hypothetical protein D3C72_2065880 [compost metagenome]
MAADVDDLDLLAIARLVAHHHAHVDAAAVIALDQIFVPVAGADHAEQIAVFEGLQRLHAVDLLQAQDIGPHVGDGERRELAGVVGR